VKAAAGDLLFIPGKPAGAIMQVCGSEVGAPPYLVVFSDGTQSLVIPGPDAVLRPVPLAELPDARRGPGVRIRE
jgi:hypothetical protein